MKKKNNSGAKGLNLEAVGVRRSASSFHLPSPPKRPPLEFDKALEGPGSGHSNGEKKND